MVILTDSFYRVSLTRLSFRRITMDIIFDLKTLDPQPEYKYSGIFTTPTERVETSLYTLWCLAQAQRAARRPELNGLISEELDQLRGWLMLAFIKADPSDWWPIDVATDGSDRVVIKLAVSLLTQKETE